MMTGIDIRTAPQTDVLAAAATMFDASQEVDRLSALAMDAGADMEAAEDGWHFAEALVRRDDAGEELMYARIAYRQAKDEYERLRKEHRVARYKADGAT